MFTTKSGERIFIIDSHIALWDASPANQRNRHGEEFINCFYNYHKISPKEYYSLFGIFRVIRGCGTSRRS